MIRSGIPERQRREKFPHSVAEDSDGYKMQDPQPTAQRRLMRVLLRTLEWLIGIVLIILIVTGFVLTNLPKISADVSGSLRSND